MCCSALLPRCSALRGVVLVECSGDGVEDAVGAVIEKKEGCKEERE